MNEKEKKEKYIRPEDACRILKITNRTLFNWDAKGKIHPIRTKGGHRRFLLTDILSITGQQIPRRNICYCRVSSSSQKEDLERQVEFFRNKYPDYEIVRDIGSGLNFKRKGLNSILESAIEGTIGDVVVTHKDRLCRFGFELISRLIEESPGNGKIVVLDKQETSPEKELVDDLISIITVFSSRIYGLRSHSFRKHINQLKNPENTDISDTGGTDKNPSNHKPI